MAQMRSVDATFLYAAAFRTAGRLVGVKTFEPRRNFCEFFFARRQDNPTSCISHSARAGHKSEGGRLPERRRRGPRDRRSIAARAISGARGKVVLPQRDRRAALSRSDVKGSRK